MQERCGGRRDLQMLLKLDYELLEIKVKLLCFFPPTFHTTYVL